MRGLFENLEMTMELGNEQCQDQAMMQIKLGNFIAAMRWYNTAAARTIGHKKSDRYEARAKWCAEQAGVPYRGTDFAKDHEAIGNRPVSDVTNLGAADFMPF
jgi:low affinity Fe/Cu permease